MRAVFFWTHLVSGLLVSVFIALSAATGLTLAWEKDLVAAFDPAPGATPAPPIDTWVKGAAAATVFRDDARMPVVMHGREHRSVVDGSGALVPAEGAWHTLHTLEELHRQLLQQGDAKKVGNTITGSVALTFLLLALTGLVIWWPKKLRGAHLKAAVLFNRNLSGWRRDFNWHSVIGFWLLPVVLGISISGVVISWKWAQDLVATLASGPAPGPVTVEPGETLPYGTLLERAIAEVPEWESATLQLEVRGKPLPEGRRHAMNVIIIERGRTLPFSRHTVSLHPATGAVLQHQSFESSTQTQKVRGVLRFLHTGEIFGAPGKAIAVLACVGILVMVWTGLALSWRRFFRPASRA